MRTTTSQQIVSLLRRSHKPRVAVRASSLGVEAGKGVFSTQDVSFRELPLVVSVYPGIYTPGIPRHEIGSVEYLANLTPPSYHLGDASADIRKNAYIMNLQKCGGYIDGYALKSQYSDDVEKALDSNPSACGHLVNHDSFNHNVKIVSFEWVNVIQQNNTILDAEYFPLPNELRADGSPWYFDTSLENLVHFPDSSNHEEQPLVQKMLCGAALILTTPIAQGEELLIDYGLKEPYPEWADGWYNKSTNKISKKLKGSKMHEN